MKLLFDARYIKTSRHDGISRFSTELGNRIAHLNPDTTFIVSDPKQLNLLPKNAKFIKTPPHDSISSFFISNQLAKLRPNVVFSPMQTLRPVKGAKLVLSLHDMIYYHHHTAPSGLNWLLRTGWKLFHLTYIPNRWLLNSANLVVTVSKKSKNELLETKLTKRPIEVVYNAPTDLAKFLKSPSKPGTKNLVYMGSFYSYKNVETLVKSMNYLPKHNLILLSKISEAEKNNFEKLLESSAGKIIFKNGVSDEEYAKILSDNAILVSASLDEGFGLPIVEAATIGTPSVLADRPAFREVAENSAIFFNPDSPEDFADRVKYLTENPEVLAEKAKLAKNRAKDFSWDKSAEKLYKILLELSKKS